MNPVLLQEKLIQKGSEKQAIWWMWNSICEGAIHQSERFTTSFVQAGKMQSMYRVAVLHW